MAKRQTKPKSVEPHAGLPTTLQGWTQIAEFLGQPISVAQRWGWGKSGMPIEHRGRLVSADPRQLNLWLGREAGEPVHVASESRDLSAELRQGLSFVRKAKREEK